MRLLVLSACELSLFDFRRGPDEMVGMPVGFIQAGVAGVVAPLWAVDDRATYLLMSRFAELYLDPAGHRSPAQALALAQGWLRELSVAQLANLATIAPFSSPRLLRLGREEAVSEISERFADGIDDQTTCPYADPIYWAAFAITGC
jgi:CHAT domain-containing protein